MKKLLALMLALGMTVSLAACGGGADTADTADNASETETAEAADAAETEETADAAETSSEGIKIGVSIADQSNVFYVDIVDGMEAAVKDGDQLVITDADFDAAKQQSKI